MPATSGGLQPVGHNRTDSCFYVASVEFSTISSTMSRYWRVGRIREKPDRYGKLPSKLDPHAMTAEATAHSPLQRSLAAIRQQHWLSLALLALHCALMLELT